jgi:diaminohydroxyphosphoribosylaminopyrimidine deaminase/5-amino-6-(5-phosphoribosylamino)uracil reductase
LRKLGSENVTSVLVEGGGEVNASFLLGGFAQRVAFFYAPKILGGRDARKAVAGAGIKRPGDAIQLRDVEWRGLGADLSLTAKVKTGPAAKSSSKTASCGDANRLVRTHTSIHAGEALGALT